MTQLPAPGRFHSARPRDLHGAPRPWHRLAFIVRKLPERLGVLIADLGVRDGDRVLDFGAADSPYREKLPTGVVFIAADLAGNPRADVEIAPDGTLPLEDASVDAVLSTQVLEHVEDPGHYLAEAFRVLRPGGRMLLSTHGMMFFHPDPVDYWRWTGSGLQRAVAAAGFEVVRFEGIMGLGATGAQMVQEAFYWRMPRRLAPLFALVMQSLARLFDRLETDRGRESNAMVFALVAAKP